MPTTDIEDHNDIRLADGVTAYHGSPHEFEEFDLSKVGTGEAEIYGGKEGHIGGKGAEYGHGIYLTDSEDTANHYKEKLSKPGQGYLYEVSIAPEKEKFLNWEKRISDQDPFVREALINSRINKKIPPQIEIEANYKNIDPLDHYRNVLDSTTGEQFYKSEESMRGNTAKASSALNNLGIPGVIVPHGERSNSYVVFDPKHIKVKRRYAEGGGIKAFAIGNSIPHLERASDMIETHDDIQLAPGVEAIDEMPDQAFTSENTSRNQIPALFNSSAFERKRGSRNLDYGGGAFDKGTEYLAKEHGVESHVYDPFNRPKEHNDFVLKGFKKKPADTATVANVLNVIAEPEARLHVIKQVHNHIKPDGKAYFTVYEGDGKDKGSGNSRMTRDGWQEYRPTHSYVEEIKQVFPDVRLSGKTIVASKKPAKAYGGAIPGPRLTEDNADDFARRLIAWTFATAPLFQRAAGGEVTYPVSMPTEIKEDIEAGKAKMKHLSPQEFLDESDPLNIGKGDRHIIHSFEKHIKSGDHLGPLKLYEKGHQDGRHRANAAKDLGVKKVPVVDYRKADGGAVDDPAQTAVDTARQINPMGFYSAAAEAASKFPQKAPIDQIINKIKGQPNVKKEELDNANLADAFAGQRSVDPKEVARHLQASVPQIKERVYGGTPSVKYEPKALLERPKGFENTDDVYEVGPHGKPPHLIAVNGNNFDVWGPSGYHNSFDSFNDAVEYANQSIHGIEPTQYSEYTIPGGKNYREVVMALPHHKGAMKTRFLVTGALPDSFNSREEAENYIQQMNQMGEKIPGVAKKLAQFPMDIVEENKPVSEPYKSSHWLGIPNPLAHLRMSDRDNGKTLHLEELQSDWGQEGRSQGFKKIINPDEKKELDMLAEIPSYKRTKEQESRLAILLDKEERSLTSKGLPSAPYVTDTNQWVDLGLKRALMEAAKGGYDKLIWTPGEAQADRYDLSKRIKKIVYDPDDKTLSYMEHGRLGYETMEDVPGNVEPHEIENHIGKEAASRLLATEPHKLSGNHILEGEDLKVGGEGMKAFYDKLVPQRLSKLISQHDPSAKIERHSYPLSYEVGTGQTDDIDWEGRPVEEMVTKKVNGHVLHITPKLREAILKGGLPAFEKGGSVIDAALDVVSKLRR